MPPPASFIADMTGWPARVIFIPNRLSWSRVAEVRGGPVPSGPIGTPIPARFMLYTSMTCQGFMALLRIHNPKGP